MARARAIETRLEKLVPALDEYYSSGFLTREETIEVSRQRQHWEFRLVAKPLLLLDVRGAVMYELGLEKRLREYCIHTKLTLQHRWDIVDRIEGIYKIGLKHLRSKSEQESLRQECVLFMKQYHRNGSLSNLYGELMVMHPRRSDIWVEAAEWQADAQRNIDNARAIVQQALLTMAPEPAVWSCALRVELQFVQRLLEGLLADHRDEVRKARSRVAAATTKDGAEPAGTSGAGAAEAPEESPALIGPKLRAENEAMAHVLLDLALAKTVVEEAFDSPASGAVLLEQLLAVAGTFAFAREVVELIASTAAQKMVEACRGSADATVAAARPRGAPGASSPASSSLTIASDQQRLRVRAQWRHPHSVDTALAHYLALEDVLVNRYSTAIVDTATYLADGGAAGSVPASRRERPHGSPAAAKGAPFAAPSREDRCRAATKAVVALLSFATTSVAALAHVPGMAAAAGADSATCFPLVRQALTDALRRLALVSADGVSRVCACLLLQTAVAGGDDGGARGKRRRAEAPSPRAPLEVATAAQLLLGLSKLDKATLQTCVIEPRERAESLARDAAVAETGAHPPAKTRSRLEDSSARHGTAAAAAAGEAVPVMTWSVVQLERFLLASERGTLMRDGGVASASPGTPSSPASAAPLTAEDVERLLLSWRDDAAGRDVHDDSSTEAAAATRTQRRAAAVELLRQHGLLPSIAVPAVAGTKTSKTRGKGATPADGVSSSVATEAAWATVQHVLLSRPTALHFAPTTGAAAAPQLPLSLWRFFSAVELQEGPAAVKAAATPALAPAEQRNDSDSDSDSDDGDDSGAVGGGAAAAGRRSTALVGVRLPSFAAAGLYFLSGAPHSALSREEEWSRLEGVTSLLRCRLSSWLGRRASTRDAVEAALRAAPADVAERCIADMHDLLALAQRCQPLPRLALAQCVIPFLEGVALFRSTGAASRSAGAARDALQTAREAHEALMKLYGVSTHPESFPPLTFDGTSARSLQQQGSAAGKASTAAVHDSNAEDWVAYVVFERTVSKDLMRAKAVTEQARRAALAPQALVVRLNAL
ncbi:U3 small nucleolar RNA-associated protein 6 [Novymonas esmeraldas]|uniref:U3 small nucleolar RNA-associated protein 6 n=1 Tax=Novymonas esmeraldas TaxID=1808958 RepID=A0AAW0EYP2_9TRYP